VFWEVVWSGGAVSFGYSFFNKGWESIQYSTVSHVLISEMTGHEFRGALCEFPVLCLQCQIPNVFCPRTQ
jgi:hypothetical protein